MHRSRTGLVCDEWTCEVDVAFDPLLRCPIYSCSMVEMRLREASFLILSALVGGPRHGYGIIKDVQAQSDGTVVLRVGTLYGALDRLASEGLIEFDHEEVVDSRLRRYYRLSTAGAVRLEQEAQRSRRQAELALSRLATGRGLPA